MRVSKSKQNKQKQNSNMSLPTSDSFRVIISKYFYKICEQYFLVFFWKNVYSAVGFLSEMLILTQNKEWLV